MDRKNRLRYAFYAGLGLCIIAAGVTFFFHPKKPSSVDDFSVPPQVVRDDTDQQGISTQNSVPVHLYFSGPQSYLVAESREMASRNESASGPTALGRDIVNALIEGPGTGLSPTIPADTRLKGLYITAGCAYVDVSSDISEKHPGGCETEKMTIYAIVNSLVLNIPSIKRVKILIDGREASTLAGHIDLRSPFKANMLLVR